MGNMFSEIIQAFFFFCFRYRLFTNHREKDNNSQSHCLIDLDCMQSAEQKLIPNGPFTIKPKSAAGSNLGDKLVWCLQPFSQLACAGNNVHYIFTVPVLQIYILKALVSIISNYATPMMEDSN